ncbi:hypothetical protein PC129_g10782 [Phytophthora cactorum]|uniref:Uncharacterized protein n=1 Tax=Phytophthora cactorum TaxID=29920 RepID=A0A8T1I2C3_9STRA|nr:hypothetical protein PC128_g13847 [Phytophthora cactorum]KAG3218407.1 hypothetical protein PC129_g10782 [Phytophthora cactorum]
MGFNKPVRTFLKGVNRLDAPPRQKEPAFIALLEACLRPLVLQDHTDQAGVLCLAFFFVLHRSEIVATTATTFRWFAPKAADFAVVDAKGSPTLGPSCAAAVCIRLEGSKANQRGPPVVRMLSQSGHPLLCLVLGALLLLSFKGNLPAAVPVAVFTDKPGVSSCVTATRVVEVIQNTARVGRRPTPV